MAEVSEDAAQVVALNEGREHGPRGGSPSVGTDAQRQSVPTAGGGRGIRRGGRGRGRGVRRGSGGGRLRSVKGSQIACSFARSNDPSKEFGNVLTPKPIVTCESDFLKATLSERSRLFCAATVEKLDQNLVANKIPATRCGLMVLFVDEILSKCCAWINEKNALNAQQYNVKLSDMYRFLSILLFSNTARFSFDKTIELLTRMGLHVPGKDIIKYI